MIIGKQLRYILPIIVLVALSSVIWAMPASFFLTEEKDLLTSQNNDLHSHESNLTPPDTGLKVPIPPTTNNPLDEETPRSPFHLKDPPGVNTQIEYDPESGTYQFQNMTGSTPFGAGAYMDVNEYIDYDLKQGINKYWKERGAGYAGNPSRTGSGLIPQLRVGGDVFESIFGSNTIDIRPSGSAELIFGVTHQKRDNPNIPQKQRRQTRFNFDENIQLNVLAKIGDKIEFNLNYDTEANFDFDNKMKLKYEGKEDDIIQLLEFGDVTLPLNSSLITGSQSLFGLKTQLKFGNLTVTAVASQQNSEKQTITVSGGAQTTDFYFKADNYEENKHYFISQYFREQYNEALSELPLVKSSIVITKIEVWRTTVGSATTENRNIIAFTDLGETNPQFPSFAPGNGIYPDNNANNLPLIVSDSSQYRDKDKVSNYLKRLGLTSGNDYEKVESARLLSTNEYTYNEKLGFISLNTSLSSDQVLAVAFQYKIIGDETETLYQVGDFSNDVLDPKCLRVKLLKATTLNTKSPLWKLMMKNVYSLSAYQVSSEKFKLNILFTGDEEGVANGFFTTGEQKMIPLIRLMGLDRLNTQLDPYPDGIFDFIDGAATNGGTVNAQNGRIYFPTVEPFGADLRAVLTDPAIADKYAFDSLYTNTKTIAQQYTSRNKYFLEGSYKSSYGSEYSLNAMNIAEGSVTVSAGGIPLTENVDFTVNYSMGTVSITNEGILNSGTPITISVENQSTYGTQTRRMFGANLDYRFSDNFNVGATILNLSERPYTQKVNYSEEPINNTIWGMNFNYKTNLPFITKMVDAITFHSTTAPSTFQIEGEFAHFIPGHPKRAIGKEGVTYIDDFEAAKSGLDLKSFSLWTIASTPQGQPELFREAGNISNDAPARLQLAYGYNRAKLAWYIIDQYFYNNSTPVTAEEQSKPYSRPVYETELFPNKQRSTSELSTYMSVLNFNFYPEEKGPFNYDVDGREGFSSGINDDGTLRNPKSRWGGIMRRMDYTDFEAANYEYIEFWMMDPFIENPTHGGGKLYFNLGDVSEDILRDGAKFFESGLPADGSDENVEYTVWGRVPTIQLITNAFDNDNAARPNQDVGYDGLSLDQEREHFKETYLDMLEDIFGASSGAYTMAYEDPSGDNYRFFRSSHYTEETSIPERYKNYNNSEGNSPTDNQSDESYNTSGSSVPNIEDLNNDNTMSEEEKYYQYEIDLSPDKMVVGENYIVDMYEAVSEPLANKTRAQTKWYQFRIPIKNPDKVIGNIQGYNSIRFMRIFMRDFDEPLYCRLATLELVRSDWRTYQLSLMEDGDYLPSQGDGETTLNVAAVSLEENGNRVPIPYELPPGVEREQGTGSLQTYLVNEQSLTMRVTNLADGDARAIYKSTGYDLRQFKHLKMYIHAEDVFNSGDLNEGDITVFVRLGSDFTDNYYEYEIPVEITPWGVGKNAEAIWPEANNMDIPLDSLVAIKQRRNVAVRQGYHENYLIPYSEYIGERNSITVVGMPNLADVTTLMIGIRNPKKKSLNDRDDMLPKSVEIWINELRLSGFNEKAGFAALGRARLNLADVGDLTLSGTYSTPGFGTLEQSVTERSQETNYTIDFATNLDGGKILFPEKWNIKVPVHYDYSLNTAVPEYNPLNPDVKLKDDLKTYSTKGEKDSIKRLSTAVVQRQNVNLMNVRKERNFDKPIKIRPWDVENLDFSYSYSEVKSRDIDVEFDNEYRHEGQIGYTFNHSPKNYRPFSKSKALKSNWLQLIRDVNFYLLPKSFVFRTSVTRELSEFKYRPKSQGNVIIDTNFVKAFNWDRSYSLIWDLTQALKIEYNAIALATLDEPQGLIDTRDKKDSVWRSFGTGGRTTSFNQNFSASYQIPINKIPIFNWLTANARYTSRYTYTASALSLDYLGNTIQNSNTVQGTGNVNFVTLYNNVPYLKKVNQGNNRNQRNAAAQKEQNKKKKKSKGEGEEEEDEKKKEEDKVNVGKIILDGSVRFLMMLRNASLSYSEGSGQVLPGFMHSPDLFGVTFSEAGAPGFLFVFGDTRKINEKAAEQGWLTRDTTMNSQYQRNKTRTFNFRASVEPFRDFRIDVTANRNQSWNDQEYFRVVQTDHNVYQYKSFSKTNNGSFSMTYVGLSTFFSKGDDVFNNFIAYRQELAKRVADNNPYYNNAIDPETGYPVGYGETQQDVLVAAFLAAYGGKNPDKMDVTTAFPKIPLPNWRINYTGLTKIPAIKKVFQSFSLVHSYTSTYSTGNYSTNARYEDPMNHKYSATMDDNLNYYPNYDMTQVSIAEQFGPLIGIDMTFTNSLLFRVEYKKSRNVSMSFTNNQITEVSSQEFVISSGYRFKDLKLGFVFSGMKRQVVSDLNVTLGFGLKDNETIIRKIIENTKQTSSGMLSMTINIAADYQISSMVGIRFFYDQVINKPKKTGANQYDNMNFDCGISVRLMLAQ